MIKEDEMIFCLKISEHKWVEALKNGTACFNPIDVFIKKAENDGNNEQGDRYEGVFARLSKNNPKIREMLDHFKEDLEIIEDGEYRLLRRYSVKDVLIFCMYGIKAGELKINESDVWRENDELYAKVRYDFPDKMLNGFLNNAPQEVWGFYSSAGDLHISLENALKSEKLSFKKDYIKYDIDLSQEFFIEPDNNYSELYHKRKELEYQHEIRYMLCDYLSKEKKLITYSPLSDRSAGIAGGELYLEMKLKVEPINN